MKLIYHDESKPISNDELREGLQKGLGVEKPERIHGYQAFFFRVSDIYAYGSLERVVDGNEKMEKELKAFVERFKKQDWGFITRGEFFSNVEQRCLWGLCDYQIARYSFENPDFQYNGGVVLEFFRDFGLFYFISEDMSEIYKEQFGENKSLNDIHFKPHTAQI